MVALARSCPLRERDVTGPVFRTYNAECFTTRYSITSAFQLPNCDYKTFRPTTPHQDGLSRPLSRF